MASTLLLVGRQAMAESLGCEVEATDEFCRGWQEESDGGAESFIPDADDTGETAGDPQPELTYRGIVDWSADGGGCLKFVPQRVWAPQGATYTPWQVYEIRQAARDGADRSAEAPIGEFRLLEFLGVPICLSEATPPTDPRTTAQEAWARLSVKSATPAVHPGFAITGLPIYLELGGPRHLEASVPVPDREGHIHISATPFYTIDWDDDGAVTRTHSPGVAYPGGDGEISYTYVTAERRAIQVTTSWSGWFVDPSGNSEYLGTRLAPTISLNLDVRQLRSVRIARGHS